MPNLFSWSTWTPYIWKQQNRQTLHYKLVTKGETSFNCANCKHPMRLKAHRQNGDGYIWRAFPIYMLYMNYFSTILKMIEFMSRGRHIMLQKLNIIFFRVALKPLAVKNVNRKKNLATKEKVLRSLVKTFLCLISWLGSTGRAGRLK